MADIYLNKLVYSYVAEQDQKHYTFYMIPDFIIATSNQKKRDLILEFLENIQQEAKTDKYIYILICAEIHPLRCLIKPELYKGTHMQRFSSMTDDEKIYRWLKVLTNFTEYITYETPNSNESNTPTNTKQQNELKEYIDHNLTWPDSTFNQQKTHEVSKNVHEITQKAHQFLANAGSPYFCESSFWASKPKFAAKA